MLFTFSQKRRLKRSNHSSRGLEGVGGEEMEEMGERNSWWWVGVVKTWSTWMDKEKLQNYEYGTAARTR